MAVDYLKQFRLLFTPETKAYESVGGFIIHVLGKIPKMNEKIVFEGLEMTIVSADMRKIDKIIIKHIIPSSPTENEENQT